MICEDTNGGRDIGCRKVKLAAQELRDDRSVNGEQPKSASFVYEAAQQLNESVRGIGCDFV
jgi:hypothetical protein